MSDEMMPPELTGQSRRNLTRRGMIGGAAGVGLATVVAATPANASTGAALRGQRFDMVLRVTRAMAQFPLEFPAIQEKASPALTRASAPRLAKATRRLKARNLARVNAAADSLLADGMLSKPLRDLVLALGSRSAADKSLLALAALSVATLAPVNDPNQASGFALTWLGMLGRMHEQGTLAAAVKRRGIR